MSRSISFTLASGTSGVVDRTGRCFGKAVCRGEGREQREDVRVRVIAFPFQDGFVEREWFLQLVCRCSKIRLVWA